MRVSVFAAIVMCLAIKCMESVSVNFTSSSLSIQFGSTLRLQNVTISEFTSTSKGVLISSLSDTLNTDSSHISFVSEKSKKWSNGLYEIDALFKVTVYSSDYTDVTFSNSSELYNTATGLLTASSDNHNFVRSVKYYAHLENDNLESISSVSFVNSLTIEDSSSDKRFSTLDVFAVVVAGLVLITVICGFCFFYVFCHFCHPKTLLESFSSKNRSSTGVQYTDLESNPKNADTVDVSDVVASIPFDIDAAPGRNSETKSLQVNDETKTVNVKDNDVALGEISDYYPSKDTHKFAL